MNEINLSEPEWQAHMWLARAWEDEDRITSCRAQLDKIISELSGIGKYDVEFIPTQNGTNSVETKYLEYSDTRAEMEKAIIDRSVKNKKTKEYIDKLQDKRLGNMLYDRYIVRLSWKHIGDKYHYAQRQPYRLRHQCLTAIRPLLPEDEIQEVCYGK